MFMSLSPGNRVMIPGPFVGRPGAIETFLPLTRLLGERVRAREMKKADYFIPLWADFLGYVWGDELIFL